MRRKTKRKYTPDWSFDDLQFYDKKLSALAAEYKLDIYPNQIEIISAEQMLDVYSTIGMPLGYNHWSYGKHYMSYEKNYKRGAMGLAYELVINSNPCISYLLEENTLALQVTILAHACYGHNSFFKNNYLFKTWTDAESIVDYLIFARNFINECEERHGVAKVEELLDACHTIRNYGVDRYKRAPKLSVSEEQARQKSKELYLQSQVNELWRTLPDKSNKASDQDSDRFPAEPEENILYFLEKNAPLLEPWQREIIRIVRKISQYFYPQRQTKVMNEGYASFWHYELVNRLYQDNQVDNKFMLEFLHLHTEVIRQLDFDHPGYSGINPYTLGFNIYQDIKRICEAPTDEDKAWFPDIAGTDWVQAIDFAMRNYKDESFVAQYLSPKVIRDLKLFSVLKRSNDKDLSVTQIHDEEGYRQIRELLSKQYDIARVEPNVQIYNVDKRGDRSLTLRHIRNNDWALEQSDLEQVMLHLHRLWGFTVKLESVSDSGKVIEQSVWPPIN